MSRIASSSWPLTTRASPCSRRCRVRHGPRRASSQETLKSSAPTRTQWVYHSQRGAPGNNSASQRPSHKLRAHRRSHTYTR
eukprot:6212950-Pleurochrysis_carterae.AAC.2